MILTPWIAPWKRPKVMPNFSRCVPKSSLIQLAPEVREMLLLLEALLDQELIVNSAFRTVEHEKKQGRSGSSSHCKGLAVDVSCYDSRLRYQIVEKAMTVGFDRIGIGKTFIHLDIDKDKVHPIIFHYYG